MKMSSSKQRRETADRLLQETGLLEKLKEYGEPHIIGSYRMDMMAWNDLDIDLTNDGMSLERLYELTQWIFQVFHPEWYEAKQEINDQGKTVWFHGFHAWYEGELWNFDLWFFDRDTIEKAERFCDQITSRIAGQEELKQQIISIKQQLIERNLYSFDQYHSMDVYYGVLDLGLRDIDQFLKEYQKGNAPHP